MRALTNKIAVVIGGSGGIGGAISHRFAAEGARVYATSRTATVSASNTSSDHHEGSIRSVIADASDISDLERLFEKVRAEEGRIDVLVVNAGMGPFAMLGHVTEELFDQTFGLNVRAMLFAAQGAIDLMTAGGAIVLVGSIADVVGTKGYGVYGASKAAVRSLARTWANELAPRGIRVPWSSPRGSLHSWPQARCRCPSSLCSFLMPGRR